jgi:hypothetical protein
MDKAYTYITAFLPYWWAIFSAGTLFGLDAVIRDRWPWGKKQLDRISSDWRKRIEITALVLAVFYAGYEAWIDEYAAVQRANNDIGLIQGERDEARRQRDANVSHVQDATINRLSGDLETARGKIDAQTQQIEAQEIQLKKQAEEIAKLLPKPPRHLNDTERQNLIRVFTPLKGEFQTLVINAPEGEPQGYAKDFMDIFNSIGISVPRIGLVFATSASLNNGAAVPLQVAVKDNKKAIPPAAEKFAEALVVAGFSVEGGSLDNLGDDQFALIVPPR